MKHIDEFTIHRFRGIRDLKLEGLGQINLLVGNNNSGKTSVLEALSIYCDPLNMGRWYEAASSRVESQTFYGTSLINNLVWLFPQEIEGEAATSPGGNDILMHSLQHHSLKKVITATFESFSEIAIVNYQNAQIPGTFEEREEEIRGITVEVSISGSYLKTVLSGSDEILSDSFKFSDRINPRFGNKGSSFALASQFITPFSHRLSSLSPQLWSGVVELDMKSEVLKLLNFFDRNIQDVDIITPSGSQITVSVKHKKLKRASLSTFGDGLRRIFTLATSIPRAKGGLLLVDELETAIHTRVLNESFHWLVNTCIQNNVQLFATTHSLETVDAIIGACAEEPIDLVAYRLENGEEHTDVTRFDKGLITRLREELGLEIR